MSKKGLLAATIVLLSVITFASSSFGAGFALYEGSARGNALGGTLVGRADDPSALFFNPAGITQLPGLQMMGGATFIVPKTDVITTNLYDGSKSRSETKDNVWIPPHLYASYQLSDRFWLGLGVFSQFGLGTEFDESWAGRYNSYNAVLRTLSINPNIAIKLNDYWSVAVGLSAMWLDLKLEQKIDATGIFVRGGKGDALQAMGIPTTVNDPTTNLLDVDQSLTGDSWGYGANIGIRFTPRDWLAAGISYRSSVKQDLDGDADFTKSPTLSGIPGTEVLFNDTGVEGKITLPDMFFFGLMVKPMERLSVEVGAIYTVWSDYKLLRIKYDDPIVVVSTPEPSAAISRAHVASIDEAVKAKNWDDVWRYCVGIEYKATDWLDLRFGYIFDESPIPDDTVDYLLPANDRHLYNTGLGFHWKDFTLDLSYTYLVIEDREVEQRQIVDGILKSEFENGDTHLFGLSLSYRF